MKASMTQASLNSSDSTIEVPLLHLSKSGEDDEDHRHHSSSSTTKKATAGILIVGALFLLGRCFYGDGQRGEDWIFLLKGMLEDSGKYGVDLSWPIHGPIRYDNNPWYHDRHQLYLNQLEGCRNYYKERNQPTIARTCDVYEYDRILMNRRQPQSMQNYTKLGFQKVKAPERVKELVKDFWGQNKAKQVMEQWPEGNVYLNWWDSPSYMVSVDDTGLRGSGYNLKRQIWSAAQSTISQWTGGQDITPVSMYGIRVYTNGSLLIPHVDRLPLVASAMVNVAQDVEEDWPIEMYDHSGRAHNITLHPGDMLLFESHSVIHGRPFPMKGKFYAMLFIHFEPTGKVLLQQNGNGPAVVAGNSIEQPTGLDEQYRQAVNDRVGGQSSSEQSQLLPPYIKRFSPEEEHWQREHPEGWVSPASYPAWSNENEEEDVAEDSEVKEGSNNNKAKATAKKKKNKHTQKEQSISKEHKAAREGDYMFWQEAIKKSKGPGRDVIINKRDAYGWMPIHESAANGQQKVLSLLLRYGADINARANGGRGGTPLFLAQQKLGADHPIVEFLKSRGALSIPPDGLRDEL